MKDIVEELANLFKYSKLPMPSPVEEYDRNLARELGISNLDEAPTYDS